ncbi:MAG: S41 family peptidase [Chitinophagales bacterium]|nr:S41 family peptidase [Chitinophagales bacterium]MCZ2393563.1 S41 family peptidase [Chitinophagales bacterium]
MSNPFSRNIWFPLAFAIILASGIYLGYNIQESRSLYHHIQPGKNSNPIEETLKLIQANYVEEPELNKNYDQIIENILSDLDPHSYFIPAKEMQSVNEEMSGNFEGIGIEFFIVNDTIQVVTPIPGGPSAQLGVLSGDQIIKVNDSLVAGIGISNENVVKKLKGPKGTKVKVSIHRAGQKDLIDFTIQRDKIPLYSIDASFKIDKNTGYIKIGRFSGQTYNEFKGKLAELKKQNIEQLIIDLRQNPGGFLEEAVQIISEILGDDKEVVYIEGRTISKESYKALNGGSFLQGKVAVLIDEGSASASEILAGAVQDWDRGVIIGRRSFGKGLVQQQFPLSNGSAIRLTIAKYYTPSGRSIQRPYIKGHGEEYNHDIEDRYTNGELFTADDNFALAQQDTANEYFTKVLKRPVFGGGGIAPDYFIPFDTSYINAFSMQVFAGGWVQEFIYDYFNKHSSQLKKYKTFEEFDDKYQISNELYQTFINFCTQTKKAQKVHLANEKVKNEIIFRLKVALAKQLFNSNGASYVIAKQDASVNKAIEILNSKDYLFGK